LSAIIGAGAVAVNLHVYIYDETTTSHIEFRYNGGTNTQEVGFCRAMVANTYFHYNGVIVPCDANRIIEYMADNTTITDMGAYVMGWYM